MLHLALESPNVENVSSNWRNILELAMSVLVARSHSVMKMDVSLQFNTAAALDIRGASIPKLARKSKAVILLQLLALQTAMLLAQNDEPHHHPHALLDKFNSAHQWSVRTFLNALKMVSSKSFNITLLLATLGALIQKLVIKFREPKLLQALVNHNAENVCTSSRTFSLQDST